MTGGATECFPFLPVQFLSLLLLLLLFRLKKKIKWEEKKRKFQHTFLGDHLKANGTTTNPSPARETQPRGPRHMVWRLDSALQTLPGRSGWTRAHFHRHRKTRHYKWAREVPRQTRVNYKGWNWLFYQHTILLGRFKREWSLTKEPTSEDAIAHKTSSTSLTEMSFICEPEPLVYSHCLKNKTKKYWRVLKVHYNPPMIKQSPELGPKNFWLFPQNETLLENQRAATIKHQWRLGQVTNSWLAWGSLSAKSNWSQHAFAQAGAGPLPTLKFHYF